MEIGYLTLFVQMYNTKKVKKRVKESVMDIMWQWLNNNLPLGLLNVCWQQICFLSHLLILLWDKVFLTGFFVRLSV